MAWKILFRHIYIKGLTMFILTKEWLFENYGSTEPGQVNDTRNWLLRYGKNVSEAQLEEWSNWKHISEYQVNTPDIVPQCLAKVGTKFKTELAAHDFVNSLRVPVPVKAYKKALKLIKPATILELGVGGDSGISTGIFLHSIENMSNKEMLSVDRNPLGKVAVRYNKNDFWKFTQQNSLTVLQNSIEYDLPYDMVFIDTIHSYSHTLKEIELASLITNNILLDDALFTGNDFDDLPGGVKRALDEWHDKNKKDWKRTNYKEGVALLRKL